MRRIEVDLSPDERREQEHIVKHERGVRMSSPAVAERRIKDNGDNPLATGETTDGIQSAEDVMCEIKSP